VAKRSALAHAEIIAINKACKKINRSFLDEATLYVTLEPCLMCTGAIFQARIKRVVYGAKEPKFGVLGSLMDLSKETRFNHRFEVTSGLMEDDISAMMKEFFQKLREKAGT
jgi:tRNA(adenine34) deaminase